jgi:hypothetical protein
MRPKKKLPEGSEEIAKLGKYIIVKSTLNKQPYYSIYEFYEGSNGRRYWPRGASNKHLNAVKFELERITGRKIGVKQTS